MTTLEDARNFLRDNIKAGIKCPCCKQYVKLYEIRMSKPMALALLAVYEYAKKRRPLDRWIHIPREMPELQRSRMYPKLAYWGLLELRRNDDPSKKASGYWRITERGCAFVEGALHVHGVANIYKGENLGLTGEQVSIADALGRPFDYREWMERDK
jgi:hypothetical protein